MKKTVIARKISINAPGEKVWSVLADFGNVYRVSPNIVKSYATTDHTQGLGAERHCDFAMMGAQVEERITEWQEGKSMKIDIYKSKGMPMIKDMKAEFSLESLGGTSVLIGTFEYGMSNAVGSMLNSVGMKSMNEKAWAKFMAGVKHYVETGEEVSKDTPLDLDRVELA